MYLLCVLIMGCGMVQDPAQAVALQYSNAKLEKPLDAWRFVCKDDQDAKTFTAYRRELEEVGSGVWGELWSALAEAQKGATFTAESVTWNQEQTAGSVRIVSARKGVQLGETEVHVEKQDGAWCVSTGWAEEAERNARIEKAKADLEEATRLFEDWKLDGAEARLRAAQRTLGDVPEEYLLFMLKTDIQAMVDRLENRKEGWLGGRWTSTVRQDPMTDQTNATARLTATKSVRSRFSLDESTQVVLRCHRGKLAAYITTGTRLESNWRTHSISFKHRFDDAPPVGTYGTTSTDGVAVFLRDTSMWMDKFKEKDGATWRVELPVYGTVGQTAEFDLTHSAKAVELVVNACKP